MPMRYWLSSNPKLLTQVLKKIVRVIDGVYEERGENMIFHRIVPPQKQEMAELVGLIHKRLTAFFIKKGYLEEDHRLSSGAADPLSEQNPLLAQCIAASVQNRIALGDRAGQRIRKFMIHPLEVTHPTTKNA